MDAKLPVQPNSEVSYSDALYSYRRSMYFTQFPVMHSIYSVQPVGQKEAFIYQYVMNPQITGNFINACIRVARTTAMQPLTGILHRYGYLGLPPSVAQAQQAGSVSAPMTPMKQYQQHFPSAATSSSAASHSSASVSVSSASTSSQSVSARPSLFAPSSSRPALGPKQTLNNLPPSDATITTYEINGFMREFDLQHQSSFESNTLPPSAIQSPANASMPPIPKFTQPSHALSSSMLSTMSSALPNHPLDDESAWENIDDENDETVSTRKRPRGRQTVDGATYLLPSSSAAVFSSQSCAHPRQRAGASASSASSASSSSSSSSTRKPRDYTWTFRKELNNLSHLQTNITKRLWAQGLRHPGMAGVLITCDVKGKVRASCTLNVNRTIPHIMSHVKAIGQELKLCKGDRPEDDLYEKLAVEGRQKRAPKKKEQKREEMSEEAHEEECEIDASVADMLEKTCTISMDQELPQEADANGNLSRSASSKKSSGEKEPDHELLLPTWIPYLERLAQNYLQAKEEQMQQQQQQQEQQQQQQQQQEQEQAQQNQSAAEQKNSPMSMNMPDGADASPRIPLPSTVASAPPAPSPRIPFPLSVVSVPPTPSPRIPLPSSVASVPPAPLPPAPSQQMSIFCTPIIHTQEQSSHTLSADITIDCVDESLIGDKVTIQFNGRAPNFYVQPVQSLRSTHNPEMTVRTVKVQKRMLFKIEASGLSLERAKNTISICISRGNDLKLQYEAIIVLSPP